MHTFAWLRLTNLRNNWSHTEVTKENCSTKIRLKHQMLLPKLILWRFWKTNKKTNKSPKVFQTSIQLKYFPTLLLIWEYAFYICKFLPLNHLSNQICLQPWEVCITQNASANKLSWFANKQNKNFSISLCICILISLSGILKLYKLTSDSKQADRWM